MSAIVRQAEAEVAAEKARIKTAVAAGYVRSDQEADAHRAGYLAGIAARKPLNHSDPNELVHQLAGVTPFR